MSPAATASADEYEVTVATSATAGTYLAGADGRALYIFKKDTGTTSSCYETCATAWPPFVVDAGEGATAGDGVTGAFGTTARTDGSTQVTYKGAPLYYYSGDAKAGDTSGEGLNGVWFLAAP
jgi:predicted lipoprotein with Yx(FWY)xxD motif